MTELPCVRIGRRRALGLTGGLAMAGLLAKPGLASASWQATTLSTALDWYPNANHAGLFLAEARGYFDDAGLAVDLYTPADPTTVLQTVGAGRDDLGISYQTNVLLARGEGVPVVSVAALVQHPLVCVMSLAASGIGRPGDLAGKSVGYPGIPGQRAYLETMLETDGATIDDVDLINVDFNLVPAVISGQVDAVMGAFWTHETILAEQEGYPVSIMRVEDWGVPDYYELVLVTSEQMIAESAEIISSFLAAMRQGYLETIAEPQAGLDALASAYPELDRAVEEEGIALLTEVWTDSQAPFGTQSADRWQSYGNWMKSRNLIPEGLEINSAYDDTLLPPTA